MWSAKILEIENKFKKIDETISLLIKNSKNQKKLLKEVDFYDALGLSVQEVDLLLDYENIQELDDQQIKRLILLNETLNKKYKWIDKINEAIILENSSDWKIVNKNTIQYLSSKQKQSQEKSNIIINIHFPLNQNCYFSIDSLKNNKK